MSRDALQGQRTSQRFVPGADEPITVIGRCYTCKGSGQRPVLKREGKKRFHEGTTDDRLGFGWRRREDRVMPLNTDDEVTIPTGAKIKHAYVQEAQLSVNPDGSAAFRVRWHISMGFSVRTLLYSDENRRWARGHLKPNSDAANALCATQALIGVSPWNERNLP